MESMKFQKGQTFLITVFILGIITVAVTISLAASGVTRLENAQSETKGEQSLYAARAGMEEVLYRLSSDTNFGSSGPITVTNNLDSTKQFVATISGTEEVRIATATGIVNNYVRKVEIRLSKDPSAGNVSLAYAIHAGQGGIDMSNSSQILAIGGLDANVYSNGGIRGTNRSTIWGNAWAVGPITGTGGVLRITKNGYGSTASGCSVEGNSYSPTFFGCVVSGTRHIAPAPTAVPLPDIDTAYWQAQAEAGGTISSYSQSSGTASLGPKKITGNFTLSNSAILNVTGTLWIQGNMILQNTSRMNLDASFGENGTIILLDHPTDKENNGRLTIQNSAGVYKSPLGGYILFVSTNQRNDCVIPSGNFGNASANTGMVAKDGCISIGNSGALVAMAARQISLQNGASVSYETGISSELYLPGTGVGGTGGNFGWGITSWKEIP